MKFLKIKDLTKMEIIDWISKWFQNQCDGDWEHDFGIRIETSDNPGWIVSIDISETSMEGLQLKYNLKEISDSDWYGIEISDNVFKGVGDPSKLNVILEEFRRIVEV